MPWIAPIAAPIVGAVAGRVFGKKTGKPSSAQTASTNLLNTGAQQDIDIGGRNIATNEQNLAASRQGLESSRRAMETADQVRGTGMNFLNRFSSTLGAPTNYFQSLLSGNQATTTAALAPDINRIQAQTRGATQAASTLTPRGAGRSSVLFNLPQQAASEVSGLFNTVRPQAAQGLTQIAGMQGDVGSNLMNTGTGLMGAAASFMPGNVSSIPTTGALGAQATQANILREQEERAGAGTASLASSIFTAIMRALGPRDITGAAGPPGTLPFSAPNFMSTVPPALR